MRTLGMKATPLFLTAAALLTVGTLHAGDPRIDKKQGPGNAPMGAEEPANARAQQRGLNQAIADLQNDPSGLFKRLDTDSDGRLSEDEFLRITSIGSQGAAARTGTTGITGATGATGNDGATQVTGLAGDPGLAPADPQNPAEGAGSPNPGGTATPTNPTNPPPVPGEPANPGSPPRPGAEAGQPQPGNPSTRNPE